MDAWYLVYSKPRMEKVALENLERQGYRAYLPLMANRRRRRGRATPVVEVMFPRYLFIRLSDETDDWGPVRSTLGVTGLVRFGTLPARAPDDMVAAIQARGGEDGVQRITPPDPRAGDPVRIVEGLMAGYEAIFEAPTGGERVVLLLEVAGRMTRLQLNTGQIEPANDAWRFDFRA